MSMIWYLISLRLSFLISKTVTTKESCMKRFLRLCLPHNKRYMLLLYLSSKIPGNCMKSQFGIHTGSANLVTTKSRSLFSFPTCCSYLPYCTIPWAFSMPVVVLSAHKFFNFFPPSSRIYLPRPGPWGDLWNCFSGQNAVDVMLPGCWGHISSGYIHSGTVGLHVWSAASRSHHAEDHTETHASGVQFSSPQLFVCSHPACQTRGILAIVMGDPEQDQLDLANSQIHEYNEYCYDVRPLFKGFLLVSSTGWLAAQ